MGIITGSESIEFTKKTRGHGVSCDIKSKEYRHCLQGVFILNWTVLYL